MSAFPFSIPRNKIFTMPPYSFTKYETGRHYDVKKGAPDDVANFEFKMNRVFGDADLEKAEVGTSLFLVQAMS